jgi:alpha-L-rhamnosidase
MYRLPVLFIQFCLISILLSGCAENNQGLKIYDLRCENLKEPLGLGNASPLLSWKITSSVNGTSQTAYQILVASRESLLNENEADRWNSGKVLSSQGIQLPYSGNKLNSRSLCYWKVRIWDENDKASAWSNVSCFSVGLLEKSDWQADYIGLPDTGTFCTSPQLKRTFTMDDSWDKVFLHVNSLGYHEIWVNGEKTGENVLTPVVSQFSKRSLTVTYDISPLIKKGRNDLIIWIGQGWYRKGLPGVTENGPFVKAQIEKLHGDTWEKVISTDSLWTGRKSGYSTIGLWRAGKFGGEQIDASLLLKDLSAETIDKTVWEPVTVTTKPAGEITPQYSESNKIMETIKAQSVKKLSDSIWIIDMGKTLTGWFEIFFPVLDKNQEVKMEFCDHLDKDGKFVNQGQEDRYISSGQGNEVFINKFNYHGFRYVKISNLLAEPDKNKISAFLIQTGYNLASSFQCSDPELNKIHDMIFYTLRCLSLGGYLVDCPQIERLGYGGDGNASTETAQTMFDLEPLYSNWLQAWADCIREDGGMPHTAPNPYPAGGGPYWCGFIITASWRTYNNYGDIRILEKYYPVMQKWLGYVDKYSPEGLLQPWPETDYRTWYLGDWATPEGVNQKDEASIALVNNCFIAICYDNMQKIASLLGKTSDAGSYALKTAALRERIQDRFFDKSKMIYGSGSQIDLTYPLLAGIVPDSLIKSVRQNLVDEIRIRYDGHFATGLVGIPVFTEWVVKNREADLMYSMLKKKGYPGYLDMIDNGATTTWEHWNGARSRIHNCYNGIGSWFYQAIGGIVPDENHPGYHHIIINPQIPEGLSWAKTMKETPYGTVSVNWSRTDKLIRMEIKIPAGSTASVCLPDKTSSYKINGIAGHNLTSPEITGSGEYVLECILN